MAKEELEKIKGDAEPFDIQKEYWVKKILNFDIFIEIERESR